MSEQQEDTEQQHEEEDADGDRRLSGSELNELPLDSALVRPHVERLRRAAQAELQAEKHRDSDRDGAEEDPPAAAPPELSDPFLVKFLRARDFDAEPALKLFLNYQRWRRQSPEISSSLSPSSVLGLLSRGYHAVLPQRDHSGSRVLVYRIGQWNPKEWSAFQVFSVSMMTSELISREAETQRRGLKVIFDLHGWSFSHAIQFNPSLARKISSVLMDSFPLKVRGIHLINEPLFFQPVFSMLRPFLSDKIRSRIHMHGGNFEDTLGDFFSMSLLPPELGGDGPAIQDACREWTNQLLQAESLLEQIAVHATGDVHAVDDIVHATGDIVHAAADMAAAPTLFHPNDTNRDAAVSTSMSQIPLSEG